VRCENKALEKGNAYSCICNSRDVSVDHSLLWPLRARLLLPSAERECEGGRLRGRGRLLSGRRRRTVRGGGPHEYTYCSWPTRQSPALVDRVPPLLIAIQKKIIKPSTPPQSFTSFPPTRNILISRTSLPSHNKLDLMAHTHKARNSFSFSLVIMRASTKVGKGNYSVGIPALRSNSSSLYEGQVLGRFQRFSFRTLLEPTKDRHFLIPRHNFSFYLLLLFAFLLISPLSLSTCMMPPTGQGECGSGGGSGRPR